MIQATRDYLKTFAGLIAVAVLIVPAILAAASLQANPAGAGPEAQGMTPGLGPFGTTEENNTTAELESLGYAVDAVGSPRRSDGTPDRTQVVVLMQVQSPNFSPDERIVTDPEARKQLWAAFDSEARNFPSATQFAAGLIWGGYIFIFPARATDVAAAAADGGPDDDFWLRTEREASAIDAGTWQPVYDRNFLSKDFARAGDWEEGLPPSDEPALVGDQIRIQPGSAYLPDGGTLKLVATVRTADGEPAPGRQVTFAYTPEGEEAQQVASVTTGNDGSGRASIDLPSDAGNLVIVSASTSDVSAGASIPIQTGPMPAQASAIELVSSTMRLQGYSVLGTQFPAQGATGPRPQRATVLVAMSAPRFDMTARAQILTVAGTTLTAMPGLTTAEPVLLYRSGGTGFELVFRVERADWDAWLAGSITEAALWDRITLSKVIDVQTGQPVNAPDFVNKDFADSDVAVTVSVPSSVESRLAQEAWGEQLYTGRIRIAVGATGLSFTVEERTVGAEFAIYRSTDPLAPVYSSAADSSGSDLANLVLDSGQYILAVQGGAAPSRVRLSYLERLMGTGR